MSQPNQLIADPGQPGPKRALILAGGGVRVAYQAGVLQALAESGLSFTHLDGTSGGIFNTAMLASGLGTEEIMDRWKKLKLRYFMSGRPAKEYLQLGRLMAFGDADKIRSKVFPALGIALDLIRRNRDLEATFNVCNFSEKTIEAIPHHAATEDHLIAGVSLPIFMPALQINGDWYSDAVWVKDANLMEAVRRGAEELWLVWAIGNTRTFQNGSFNQYVHMIEMSANGGLLEEYAQIQLVNELIRQGRSPYGQSKPIKLHVLKPTVPLPLDPDLFFGKIDTTTLINWGYADARLYLAAPPAAGVPFGPAATQMRDPGPTLSFRSRFSGSLQFDGAASRVAFYPAFSLHDGLEKPRLTFTGSLEIESWGLARPTFKNEAAVINTTEGKLIRLKGFFEGADQTYSFLAEIPLHSPLYWLMGLDLKKVYVKIFRGNADEGDVVAEGPLYQSIRLRLQYLSQASLRHNQVQGRRFRQKWGMLSMLYNLEEEEKDNQDKEEPELVTS